MKKTKKIVTYYVCFCSSAMLTSKIITEIIENHSEFSGCSKSCNHYVSSRSWSTTKSPMILLWKAVVVGVQAHPKSFDLLKICAEMTPNVAWLQKMAPKVFRKTHEYVFRGHTKNGLNDLCGREFEAKVSQKTLRGVWGNSGKNHSHPQNFACT